MMGHGRRNSPDELDGRKSQRERERSPRDAEDESENRRSRRRESYQRGDENGRNHAHENVDRDLVDGDKQRRRDRYRREDGDDRRRRSRRDDDSLEEEGELPRRKVEQDATVSESRSRLRENSPRGDENRRNDAQENVDKELVGSDKQGRRNRSRREDGDDRMRSRRDEDDDSLEEEGELTNRKDEQDGHDDHNTMRKERDQKWESTRRQDRYKEERELGDGKRGRDRGRRSDEEDEKKDDRRRSRRDEDDDSLEEEGELTTRKGEQDGHDHSRRKERERKSESTWRRDRYKEERGLGDGKSGKDRGRHSDEEDEKDDQGKKRDRRESSPRQRKDRNREEGRERDGDSDEGDEKKDDRGKKRDRRESSPRRRRDRNRDEGRERNGDQDGSRRKERTRDEYDRSDREQEKSRDRDVREETMKEEPAAVQQMQDAGVIKTGGIYIPPHRMAQMMREVQDKSSEQYQRLSWDALRKSINGLVNKVNATNIKNIIPELFSENLIRGRGLFCRSCMKSQMASPGFTDVFAALVAVVNTKFPEVGKLLLKRIVLQLKRAYKRNDKPQLLAATKFIAHLVNQQVAHEIIALELLTLLLEKPTDDSVEVAVGFVKECGALLQDFSPQGLHGIFERFRGILHEGEIDKRVQFLIEGLFAIRKAKFQGFPAIRPELDLVEQEEQFTHEVSLEDEIDPETNLDIFKANPQFLEDEKAYEDLKKSILGDESSDEEEGSDADSDDEDEEDSEEEDEESMKIKDETETNLINLRRTIYLTIMSSVDFEEAGHKLLKIKLEPGQEMELCVMLLECCSQERTYLRYYGLLGQRFCLINKVYQENFEKCFVQQYSMIHRLETNKLRNVAKFFAHLLGTSALPWHVLAYIRLTEEDTTSSSRIFIKILFQELSEHLGICLLNERLNDPTMQDSFDSIFPKDNPKNTRFSINFFTSIGLGGITESLREYLKNMPRLIMQQQQKPASESDDDSEGSSSADSSDSSSGSESDSSSSESESDSSSSDESERRRRSKRRKRSS